MNLEILNVLIWEEVCSSLNYSEMDLFFFFFCIGFADAVIRNVYYKYFHPKEALVSNGVLNRFVSPCALKCFSVNLCGDYIETKQSLQDLNDLNLFFSGRSVVPLVKWSQG